MDIVNSHLTPQVKKLCFERLMKKWQIAIQLQKAICDQTKTLSLGNPKYSSLKVYYIKVLENIFVYIFL